MSTLLRNTINQNKSIDSTDTEIVKKDYGSFFREGIPYYFIRLPRVSKTTNEMLNPPKVRILPSFNMDLYTSGGNEFLSSTVPYKKLNEEESDFILTDWIVKVRGYNFFGENKLTFLSPLTLAHEWKDANGKGYAPRHVDPIVDLKNFIFFNSPSVYRAAKKDIADKFAYLIDNRNGIPILPKEPYTFYLCNALLKFEDSEEWKNYIMAFKITAFNSLKKIINEKTGINIRGELEKGLSKDFPQFLFGDITSPEEGSVLTIDTIKVESTGQETAGFTITSNRDNPIAGVLQMPVSKEQLMGRKVLQDLDEVLNVPSYEEVLQKLVDDNAIPNEILKICYDNGGFKTGVAPNFGVSTTSSSVQTGVKAQKEESYNTEPSYEEDVYAGQEHEVLETLSSSAAPSVQEQNTTSSIKFMAKNDGAAINEKDTIKEEEATASQDELEEYMELKALKDRKQLTDIMKMKRYYELKTKFEK